MLEIDESSHGMSQDRGGADSHEDGGGKGRKLRMQMSRVQREALKKYEVAPALGDPHSKSRASLSISTVAKARIRAMKVRRGLSLQSMREKRGTVPASFLLKCVQTIRDLNMS